MRRKSFIIPLVLIVFLFLPFFAKAQIDTAWVTSEHINQYIAPPTIDAVNYNNQPDTLLCYMKPVFVISITDFSSDIYGMPYGIAQKFEVEHGDSVCIMGVATALSDDYISSYNGIFDTVKVSILNERFIEIYTKSFYTLDSIPNWTGKFAEHMFDSIITLYENYYISMEFSGLYPMGRLQLSFLTLSEYYDWYLEQGIDSCVPYGVNTKYRPYVKFHNYYGNDWIHVDDVNWYPGCGYEEVASYWRNQVLGCDTIVYAPVGICPIRALENSTITDNDSTSTGGGSQDSYIATVLADEDIELYPNPTDEVLNIRSDYNITEIEVIDAMNRVIERWELNTRELTLDVASYKSGTYFIIIKTDKGSLTKKFIVR